MKMSRRWPCFKLRSRKLYCTMGFPQTCECVSSTTRSSPTSISSSSFSSAFHFVGHEKHPHHLNRTAALAGHPVCCFFSPPLCFDTQQEQRCVLFVRVLLGWRRPVALSERLGGERGADTIKGINYNQACNGARSRCLKKC